MTKVRDAMHQGAEWCAPDTPLIEIAQLMRDNDIGSIPIGESDRLVGMVTDRDIVCRGLANGSACDSLTARDVMSEGIIYCRADEDVEDAIHLMENKQVRRLPVVDENKRLVGMLSLGDVSHGSSRELTGELAAAVAAHH